MPVLLDMAISLNGHVGRDDGSDPGLYDWYFDPSEISKPVIDELVETTGAIVLGRNAFGQGDDTGGWDDTPYEVKHFVVTSRRLSDGRRRFDHDRGDTCGRELFIDPSLVSRQG